MGVVVTFDYGTWAAQDPQQAAYISQQQATAAFNLATLQQANDGSGPINDAVIALTLLNLVTSHVCALIYPVSGPTSNPDPSSPLVGRISDATEGSVSVHAENDYPPGSAQWWQQSKYGSFWWEATAQFRTMRYLPSRRASGPWGPFGFFQPGIYLPGGGQF